jgi:hypothetical protein
MSRQRISELFYAGRAATRRCAGYRPSALPDGLLHPIPSPPSSQGRAFASCPWTWTAVSPSSSVPCGSLVEGLQLRLRGCRHCCHTLKKLAVPQCANSTGADAYRLIVASPLLHSLPAEISVKRHDGSHYLQPAPCPSIHVHGDLR